MRRKGFPAGLVDPKDNGAALWLVLALWLLLVLSPVGLVAFVGWMVWVTIR